MASTTPTESRSPSPGPTLIRTNFRDLLDMSVNNPYAQAGWSNPQNPWSVNDNSAQFPAAPPSIYGALPFAAPRKQSPLLSFQISGMNPDVLNSIVMGPNARHCFSIATSPASFHQPCVTVVRNDQGAPIARIEWHQRPVVEVENMIPKTMASQLLPLARDMSYRTMLVKGKPYAWMTHNGTIRLYNTAYSPAEMLGSLTRGHNAITLNVAADAIHHGMLEVTVVVAILLYSGRNID
ncbi:hypothetical protein D9611_010509 [Ephemerocybe angulata]|uniref:DUF6593 domain-containing protein n=1 Tax=Ephemerocybe angulata TaxID=980116 RepID=A0A8H5FAR5_9AGAR|nr:hypothetical protein D9611_010509 [Tulosesus angulatus]